MDKAIVISNINKLVSDSNLSRGAFADMVGIPRSNFSKILNGNYPCGEGVINKIVLATKVRKEWLKTGEGDIYEEEQENIIKTPYIPNNANSIIERIKILIDTKSRSSRAFANNIGFSYSTLNNYLLGKRTTIDSDLLYKIISTYSDINSEWLLTGKGEMLKNISENSENLLKQTIAQDRNNSVDELITNMIKKTVMNEIPAIIKAVGEAMRGQLAEQNSGLEKYLESQKEASRLQMELFRDVVKILAKSDPEAKELDNKLRQLNRKIG